MVHAAIVLGFFQSAGGSSEPQAAASHTGVQIRCREKKLVEPQHTINSGLRPKWNPVECTNFDQVPKRLYHKCFTCNGLISEWIDRVTLQTHPWVVRTHSRHTHIKPCLQDTHLVFSIICFPKRRRKTKTKSASTVQSFLSI